MRVTVSTRVGTGEGKGRVLSPFVFLCFSLFFPSCCGEQSQQGDAAGRKNKTQVLWLHAQEMGMPRAEGYRRNSGEETPSICVCN